MSSLYTHLITCYIFRKKHILSESQDTGKRLYFVDKNLTSLANYLMWVHKRTVCLISFENTKQIFTSISLIDKKYAKLYAQNIVYLDQFYFII